jgi:enolase
MTATISAVSAREILDSGGRPTVEVDLALSDGTRARSSVPSGASTGRHEAHELRDGDEARFAGNGVLAAVANARETIGPAVLQRDPFDQEGLATLVIELDGSADTSRLEATALVAVSTAVARSAASSQGIPLWRHLGDGGLLPLPMVNIIISGGLRADAALAFQISSSFRSGRRRSGKPSNGRRRSAVRPANSCASARLSTLKAAEGGFGPSLDGCQEALDLLVEAVERSGRVAGKEVAFAIDVAATHFFDGGSYRLSQGSPGLDATGLVEMLARLVADYPLISLEDGVAKDDWDGWSRLTRRLGDHTQILGDDLFTTSPARLASGIERGVASSVLVKMNQIGTLTETLEVIGQAGRPGYATSSRLARARPRTISSPTWPLAAPPVRSRSGRLPSRSGSRSTTSCSGSRRSLVRRRSSPGATPSLLADDPNDCTPSPNPRWSHERRFVRE